MDVEHQVLQVGVDACLGVDRSLLIGQEVVELDDADRDRFELLRFQHDLLEHRVFNDLVGDYGCKVTCLRDVPPIIAVE